MNNAMLGKTMENLRNRVDVKIVRSWEGDKICRLVASPSFARYDIFGKELAGIHMHKSKVVSNKPMYTGMTILENSKILLYDFSYNNLKPKCGPRCELIYTDTDSLLLEIQMEDVYNDMAEDIWLYNRSNFPKDHPLYSDQNRKVLGKMKDECEGRAIKGSVTIRPEKNLVLERNHRSAKLRG